MKIIIYAILSLSVFFISCTDEDTVSSSDNNRIELSFLIDNYSTDLTKATSLGSEEEQKINDLYIYLFPTVGSQSLVKYYVSSSSFTGGTWDMVAKKIAVNLTQAEIGKRDVYIVANCSAIKSNLDAVTSISGLQSVLQTASAPWIPNINTPLLMSGNKSHDFNNNYQLNSIPLVRAVAKLQLNIKLSDGHRSLPVVDGVSQYKYKLVNFDKNTYVLKPSVKPDNLVSSASWTVWDAAGTLTSYSITDSKVNSLSLTTYFNERDNAGAAVEISLPYQASGPLPPPEFGDESYKLLLPAKIERNHWYIYDIEI